MLRIICLITVMLILISSLPSTAQASPYLYGGNNNDESRCIIATKDGNLAMAAIVSSKDGDFLNNKLIGGTALWVCKINPANGEPLFSQFYGHGTGTKAYDIIETRDGCLAVAGRIGEADRESTGDLKGKENIFRGVWVLKINPDPDKDKQRLETIVFSQCYGGTSENIMYKIIETRDGCLALAGETFSQDGDLAGVKTTKSENDLWVLKVRPDSSISRKETIVFNQCYGGSNSERAFDMIESKDGYLSITGYADSKDGDLTGLKNSYHYDVWLLKIDANAKSKKESIKFNQIYGGDGQNEGHSIVETRDGYLTIAAFARSTGGDLKGKKSDDSADLWLLKIDTKAKTRQESIKFSQCYGGGREDNIQSIIETKDGNLALAGWTDSKDRMLEGKRKGGGNDWDVWVLKIESKQVKDPKTGRIYYKTGAILSNQCYGGTANEKAYRIVQTAGGSLYSTGWTESADKDFAGKRKASRPENCDIFIIKN